MFPGGFRAKLNSRFLPPCVCVRNRGGRAAPLLPLPLPIARLCVLDKYVNRLKSEEWTFLACAPSGHALSFLATRWNTAARAFKLTGVWDQFEIQTAFARRSRRE